MKYFLIFLFLSFKMLYSQKNWADETFYKDCKNNKETWATISFKNTTYSYSLIEKSYEYSDEKKDYFKGTILIKLPKKNSGKGVPLQVLSLISKRIKLNKFTIFKTCEAHRIYISAMGPKNLYEKYYLYSNTIGYYNNGVLNASSF